MNTANELTAILPKLRSFAKLFYQNESDQEDLVQETVLKVLKGDYKDIGSNLFNYACMIMRNSYINHFRRQKIVRNAFANHEPDQNSASESFDIFEQMRLKDINKAIEELSEKYNSPLTLYVQGYKYKEISKILGIDIGTVKSRIFFARKQLKTKLAA